MEQEYKWNLTPKMNLDEMLSSELLSEKIMDHSRVEMKAIYYDTPDRLFGSMRGALRLRTENGESVCCMKVERSVDGACSLREEYEIAACDVYEGLSLLPAQGAPISLCRRASQGELLELCRTEFVRVAYLLEWEENGDTCRGELAVDTGCMAREGRTAPISEIEFEYKQGSVGLFHSFARRMGDVFALEQQELSKLARAMAL